MAVTTPHETLEQEIARNDQIRAQIRADQAKAARRQANPLYQAAKWGLAPLKEGYGWWRETFRHGPKRKKAIAAYVAGEGFKGLQIGCGPHRIEGWLNTDLMPMRMPWRAPDPCEGSWDFPMDITRPLPFPDASLDAIFGEEVIEHIPRSAVFAFLPEAKRVLKPGGVLKLTTPDLDACCKLYLGQAGDLDVDRLAPFWLDTEWSRQHWINCQFRDWGHQFIWTEELMLEAL
ncbi:MAG: methyltransferase domain-containing protein, partial [Pseudomonadota bacterium]